MKQKITTVDHVKGGRYTLVDRHFKPYQTPILQPTVGLTRREDQRKESTESPAKDETDCPIVGKVVAKKQLIEEDTCHSQSDDDDSMDTLLEEAKQYLELASTRYRIWSFAPKPVFCNAARRAHEWFCILQYYHTVLLSAMVGLQPPVLALKCLRLSRLY